MDRRTTRYVCPRTTPRRLWERYLVFAGNVRRWPARRAGSACGVRECLDKRDGYRGNYGHWICSDVVSAKREVRRANGSGRLSRQFERRPCGDGEWVVRTSNGGTNWRTSIRLRRFRCTTFATAEHASR